MSFISNLEVTLKIKIQDETNPHKLKWLWKMHNLVERIGMFLYYPR